MTHASKSCSRKSIPLENDLAVMAFNEIELEVMFALVQNALTIDTNDPTMQWAHPYLMGLYERLKETATT